MPNVTLQPSGHQFPIDAGETVLEAALRAGFILPYGCKDGACGSCKGKVLSGTVDYGNAQKKALTDEEKAQGKALFCQARARHQAAFDDGLRERPGDAVGGAVALLGGGARRAAGGVHQ